MPKELVLTGGHLSITDESRIVCPPKLRPAAEALRSDLAKITGIRMEVANGDPRRGDLVFRATGSGESYRIEVGDRVEIAAPDLRSANWATATLLQSLDGRALPRMTISDRPDYSYRGVMLDLARKVHSIEGIRQIVDLCRLYKLPYLHLHLSDDHLFMFPSKAFPNLGSGNHEFARFDPPSVDGPIRPYRPEELRELDRYAQDRGVTIIPEIDMPGHGSRLTQDAPTTFRASASNPAVINLGSKRTLDGAKTLLSELMEAFPNSPYIHLGGDEVWMGELEKHPDFVSAMAELRVDSAHQLYRRFISEMNAHIRSKGKRMIVWEEAYSNEPGERWPLPKDATIMVWSVGGKMKKMLDDGYSIINAGWTPLYIVREDKRPPEFLEKWNPTLFGPHTLSFTDWLPASGPGLIGAQMCSWENSESTELQTLRRRLPILAERTWNRDLRLGTIAVRDDLVDRLIGGVRFVAKSPLVRDENTFEDPLTLELVADPGLTIRYRLDNRAPSVESPIYEKPLVLEDSAWIRAAAFDASGRQVGPVTGSWYSRRPKFVANLATGKRVTVTNPETNVDPQLAVDGDLDRDRHWAGRTPSSLTVDLEAEYQVDRTVLITYSDGGRYYQYVIEGSLDGRTWTMIDDGSTNTGVASPSGYVGRPSKPVSARFVRVTMLKNSANPGTHIVELMVFGKSKN